MAISKHSMPDELINEINNALYSDEIINAVNSLNANELVLKEAIKRTKDFSSNGGNQILSEVVGSDKVTSSVLVDVINVQNDSMSTIIKAVKSSKANELVLKEAIKMSKYFYTNDANQILSEVVDSDKVTSSVLVDVINAQNATSSIIIKAVDSLKADASVLDAASRRANVFFSNDLQAILMAIEARKITLAKQVNKVPPPPPKKSNDMDDLYSIDRMFSTNGQSFNNSTNDQIIVANDFTVEEEENATERLRRNVEDGMSTMLWGLSGIGKTARVRQIDPTFTMIKLKNGMLPEEVTGGKEPNGEPGQIYPPTWYVKLCEKCNNEPDRMHVLFIDELTNVRDNVKTLVWDIIGDRRVDGNEDWELPENCSIVAAGNRPEESTAVVTDYNGGVLPEPLHDRFDFHIEIPLDMKEWRLWALETNPKTGNLNIHPTVLSFCIARPNEVMFGTMDPNDVTKPRISPRRWEKLSKAIYMAEKRGGKKCHVSNQRITECIGSDLAPAFIAHYEKPPLDIKMVEAGRYTSNDFRNIDDKLFALSSLVTEYTLDEMIVEDFIINCLGDEYWVIYREMRKQRDVVLSENKGKEIKR